MAPSDELIQEKIAVTRALLEGATSVAVLTGAGISAASGIPTFRGAQDALWARYRPEDLATPEAFSRDPQLVWRWYDWRRGLIAASEPNPAHLALARLAERKPVTLITQNVDGYHQLAGSRGVLEFHGSIWKLRCTACAFAREDRQHPLADLPRCPECGAVLRPGVVWFGEMIDTEVIEKAATAVSTCPLMLVIGTAGAVHPAAGLVDLARGRGVRVCEFNLEPSLLTPRIDVFIPGDAAETLPRVIP